MRESIIAFFLTIFSFFVTISLAHSVCQIIFKLLDFSSILLTKFNFVCMWLLVIMIFVTVIVVAFLMLEIWRYIKK